MKILVVADLHANWAALSAITQTFDACLCLGDLVEYGPAPAPCIEWARTHALASIRGNHDHAVAQRVPGNPTSGFRALAAATRSLALEQLKPTYIKYLSRLPLTRTLEIDGHRFFLVHATPRDPLDEYLPPDPELWEQRLADVDADFVCVGHTHLPMDLQLERKRVINPGSVGQPRDGDPRASYVVIDRGEVQFHRVTYDIDLTVQQLRDSGLEPNLVEFAEHVLRTGGQLPSFPVNRAGS